MNPNNEETSIGLAASWMALGAALALPVSRFCYPPTRW